MKYQIPIFILIAALVCILIRLKRKKSLRNEFPLSRETDNIIMEDCVADDGNTQHPTHPQIEYLRRLAEDLMTQKYDSEDESDDENEIDEAAVKQALKLYRQIIALAQQHHLSGEYYPALNVYMAEISGLGNHYIKTLQFDNAAATFRQMRAVAASVPDNKCRNEYMAEAIVGINNTGAAYGESGMERRSLELFLEAMNDYQQLSEAVPELLSDVAMLQSNIGYLHILNGKYSKADDMLHKALDTYRYIREKNSKGYTPGKEADVYTNFGLLHLHMGEEPKACKALGRACKQYRRALRLAAVDSKDKIRAGYATALSNLSISYPPLKRITIGIVLLCKSIRLRRRLIKDYPSEKEFRSDLSGCYLNLGSIQTSCLMFRHATNSYKNAIVLREPLAAADPDRYLQSVADAYYNISTVCSARPLYRLRKRSDLELLGYCTKALTAFAKLNERGRNGNTLNIAGMHALAGEVCIDMEQYAAAQDHMSYALLQYHEIEKELDGDNWLQMMGCMAAVVELLNRNNDKHNALVMLRNLGQRYSDAPEAYRQKSESIRKRIARLAGMLQP